MWEGFEAMKKNLYKFWTQLTNAATTVNNTDFVNRDLSKNYSTPFSFFSCHPHRGNNCDLIVLLAMEIM